MGPKNVVTSSPTPYRISTITAVANVAHKLDISHLFYNMPLSAGMEQGAQGAETNDIEFMVMRLSGKERSFAKGIVPSQKKNFGNQVTLLAKVNDKPTSIKLFTNGRIQMTGIRSIEFGRTVLAAVVQWLNANYNAPDTPDARDARDADAPDAPDAPDAVDEARAEIHVDEAAALESYRICMINSDCDIGMHVKRNVLFQTMKDHYTHIMCSYEPCMYPGVKIKYMYNSSHPDARGACSCAHGPSCKGKGDGSGHDAGCRKVTIAVFQSGKAIITGGITVAQVESAYQFLLNDLVSKHAHTFNIGAPP
ncbi:hypothetical protein FOA52_001609 [Chlamydomonas sp. UWO 241]|nr:hypothetical protein FOA52_001609 [Chlamydomonas sp. UWO 241]